MIRVIVMLVLMWSGPGWAQSQYSDFQLVLGGWSHHFEDEPYPSSPTFNENHKGIGLNYRFDNCHGSERWRCHLGAVYLRDSFDNPMYTLYWNWQYPLFDSLAAGFMLGAASRSVAIYVDEQFEGTEREIVPMVAPNLELTWRRFSINLLLLPNVDLLEEDGDRTYRVQRPTLFWNLGFRF